MFKLFEWIYKLGIQHERNRIKKLFAEFALDANREHYEFEDRLGVVGGRPSKKPSKKIEINQAALSLIAKLLEPEFIGERSYGQAPIDKD